MPVTPGTPSSMHGPNRDRREYGVVKPERPDATDPAGDTPDQEGIEIDHEEERPRYDD